MVPMEAANAATITWSPTAACASTMHTSVASAKQMREQAEGCQPGLLPIEPEKDKRCQDLQKGRGQN